MTKNKSIIIYNDYKDLTVTIICVLIGIIALLIYLSESDDGTKITTSVMFFIPAVKCFNYSKKSNVSLPKTVLSFVLKIILAFFVLVKLLQLIGDNGDDTTEGKVRERTKRWQLISAGIFFYLAFDLIKEHRWSGDISSS
jgi:uncharacterized protein YhhL (DUF1145 family)